MIVKIQRPLGGGTDALIYDRDRTITVQVPFEDVKPLFGTYQNKVYADADIIRTKLVIGDIVPDQDW